jgi:hypothetical protein
MTKDRLMISHERGKDWEVFTSGTYPWSFVTQMFHIGQPSHGGDNKTDRQDITEILLKVALNIITIY